jgi:hypothetical protein
MHHPGSPGIAEVMQRADMLHAVRTAGSEYTPNEVTRQTDWLGIYLEAARVVDAVLAR